MPDFRRYYQPNSIVFITSVTKDRFPFLRADDDVKLFIETARKVQEIHPFDLLAYVILPDHFHWLMRTVDLEGNFSKILHSVKRNFSLNYKAAHQIEEPIRLWQPRFWDHVIRSERDLSLHFDYIHWNPVKHGYVRQPEEWVHSTFDFWFQRGFYPANWSSNGEPGDLQGLVLE